MSSSRQQAASCNGFNDLPVGNFFFISLALVALLSGCTIPTLQSGVPTNISTGAVIFYTPSTFEGKAETPIDIELPTGAPTRSRITRTYKPPFPSSTPACGAEGGANFNLPSGWYRWNSDRRCNHPAVVDGGSIEIKAGSCLKVNVSNLWSCPLNQGKVDR
jgi:hypothetical protein